jgi:GH18 family chitinase
MGLKVFMQLGSWSNISEWSGEKFSQSVQFKGIRGKFIASIIMQMKNMKFDGVLFSWTYPGCPRVKNFFDLIFSTRDIIIL